MSSLIRKKTVFLSTPFLYGVMIVLGLICGFSNNAWLISLGTLIADIFIRIFKCISLPIIVLSIIVTLSNYASHGIMSTLWRRTMCYTLLSTLLAAFVSCCLYLLIQPHNVGVMKGTGMAIPVTVQHGGYLTHLLNLIPTTIVSPFLENQVMTVLLMGIVVGLAIRMIPDEHPREAITQFFRGAHGLFMVITRWVVTIIPIGLFGFICSTVTQLRHGNEIKGLGEYLLVVVLANVIQGFVMLPLWLRFNGIAPFTTMKKMFPALSLAFFSKSSVGTLPVTMDTVEKRLGVDPEISRFVLPLCTSINMNGCAAFIFATVIFLMQNHGLHVTLPIMALWVFVSTLAALGNAGVPMGCFFLSASLLASMNVPITLMGIILPFYSLIDMLETALNVWSDACVVNVVNHHATSPTSSTL